MFRAVSWAAGAAVSLLALGLLIHSVPAEAGRFGGGGGGGHHFGGHFGGGHFGGGHFGGGHFGARHFGGGNFGSRHMGNFSSRRFGGHNFATRNFGRQHFATPHGRNFAGRSPHGQRFARGNRQFGGHQFAHNRQFATHGRALAATGRTMHQFGHNNFAGKNFAHNNFARHDFKHGAFGRHGYNHAFAHNAFWHNRYAWNHWNHHYHGYGWYGPVFWPYAYGDVFAFALWPYYYYDSFWGYGPDWILASLFWPFDEPGYYYGRGYYGPGYAAYDYGDIYGVRRARRATGTATASVVPAAQQEDACGNLAPGVAQFPVARLEKVIAPATDEQRAALRDLNDAIARGSETMRQACPADAPLTPPAKLDAVIMRLTAMKTAIDDVRNPLDKLYGLLSDEQRQRFDKALLAAQPRGRSGEQSASNGDVAQLCNDRGPAFTDVPAQDIEKVVNLDDSQRGKLDALKDASNKAADIAKSGCISSVPSTVGERLDATEKRVDALIDAANSLKPAVGDFYASLSDEQKARFNAMGQGTAQASRNGGRASSSTGASSGETGANSGR